MHVNTGNQAGAAPFVLGLGCERGTPADEVIRLAEKALTAAKRRTPLARLCRVAGCPREPNRRCSRLPRIFRVPFRLFDAATLEAETARLKNPSEIVFALTGCHGVAEAAALAAAGQSSALIVPKIKSANATAAVAGGAFVESIENIAADCEQNNSASSQPDSARLQAVSGVAP